MRPTQGSLAKGLQREFSEAFRMFADAVKRLDDEQWGEGAPTWTEVPARTAMHTLLCAAHYVSDGKSVDWRPNGVQWWDAPIDQLPDRAQTLSDIDRIAAATKQYIASAGDAGLLSDAAPAAKDETTKVEYMIYALRHLQHHVAQISAECKRRGLGAAEWE